MTPSESGKQTRFWLITAQLQRVCFPNGPPCSESFLADPAARPEWPVSTCAHVYAQWIYAVIISLMIHIQLRFKAQSANQKQNRKNWGSCYNITYTNIYCIYLCIYFHHCVFGFYDVPSLARGHSFCVTSSPGKDIGLKYPPASADVHSMLS